jgi:23S rRNA U2552 (ribose-2'-O)-methylase RlmE/FtsJ
MCGQVVNNDMTDKTYEGENVDHYNIDELTMDDIINFANGVLQNSDGNVSKRYTTDDIKKKQSKR